MNTMRSFLTLALGFAFGILLSAALGWSLRAREVPIVREPATPRLEPTWTPALPVSAMPDGALSPDGSPQRAVLDGTTNDRTWTVRLETTTAWRPPWIWPVGSTKDRLDPELTHRVQRDDPEGGLVVVSVTTGDSFSGKAARFRFGPGRADAEVRVVSWGDVGPPFEEEWGALNGLIRISTWPLDHPDAFVHFELFGVVDGRWQNYTGAFDPSP